MLYFSIKFLIHKQKYNTNRDTNKMNKLLSRNKEQNNIQERELASTHFLKFITDTKYELRISQYHSVGGGRGEGRDDPVG